MLHNYDVRTHTVTLELIEKKFTRQHILILEAVHNIKPSQASHIGVKQSCINSLKSYTKNAK